MASTFQELTNLRGINKNGKIGQLDAEVTRRICTGQVVISLAGACRELIDNALDAGAMNIDIRAKENGAELLEVIDNGSGIAEDNFDLLCKPHSTSKLLSIMDFNSLSTFGFRGEALNALAALSELTIITRHSSAQVATRLVFNRRGEILEREHCSRQIGTTVLISKLFLPIPVRRQEFVRNSRREFLRMLSGVQSFALSRTDCRFNCSNVVNGKRIQMLSSPGNKATLNEVISSLFGIVKAEKGPSILSIEESVPDSEVQVLYGIKEGTHISDEVFTEIHLSGYVSSCEYGCGRNSADRQFIYVNKRPVDFPKINRIVNEVYNHFNRGQYCTIILFIDVDPGFTFVSIETKLDVNVSPDKRTVFLQNEKELFAKLRSSLIFTFSKVEGSCRRGTLDVTGSRRNTTFTTVARKNDATFMTQLSTDGIMSNDSVEENVNLDLSHNDSLNSSVDSTNFCHPSTTKVARSRTRTENCSRKRRLLEDCFIMDNEATVQDSETNQRDNSNSPENDIIINDDCGAQTNLADSIKKPLSQIVQRSFKKTLESFAFQQTASSSSSTQSNSQFVSASLLLGKTFASLSKTNEVVQCMEDLSNIDLALDKTIKGNTSEHEISKDGDANGEPRIRDIVIVSQQTNKIVSVDDENKSVTTRTVSESDIALTGIEGVENLMTTEQQDSVRPMDNQQNVDAQDPKNCAETSQSNETNTLRPEQTLEVVGIETLRKMIMRRRSLKQQKKLEIRCEVQNAPTSEEVECIAEDNENSEEVQNLNLMLKREDFAEMKVIGQFNNAFIFTRLGTEMFMIDQHASDEKFNFERFKRRAQIATQKLISPQTLELGAVEESVLHDNIDIFRANGFDFIFDGKGETGRRTQLSSVPVLHGWQFNNSDIEEILGVLIDFPGVMYRPTKLRKIFASRACRRSVMFGSALTKQQMQQIVHNMGTMDQPWNCPHGRPTIRHLCTIKKQIQNS